MKRYSIIAAVLALLCCASASHAIFPGQQYGLVYPGAVGDGYLTFKMQQGWVGGNEAWYICTDTSDIKFAQWYGLTLAPKLRSAFVGVGAQYVYIVRNPPQTQGWVFEFPPGHPLYTPIMYVRFVTWTDLSARVPLTSHTQILNAQAAGDLTISDYDPSRPGVGPIRVDCPILAVYRLGGPFLPKPAPFYRIPQGRIIDGLYNTRSIQLPYWNVYCQDPTTRAISVKRVIIPDAYPANLAQLIGANVAPRLATMPNSDRTIFNVINWAQDFDPNLPGIQPLKVRIDQYPVVCACPNFCSWQNTNYAYSPVMSFALLQRAYPTPPGYPLPAETLVKTCDFINIQMSANNLRHVQFPTPPLPGAPVVLPYPPNAAAFPYVVNAPVICL